MGLYHDLQYSQAKFAYRGRGEKYMRKAPTPTGESIFYLHISKTIMPKPRKPTKVLQFTGAFDKNPQRAAARSHEPKSTGAIGAPPAELSGWDLVAWERIVDEAPKGVLTKRDRQHVFATALLGGAILGGSRDVKLISQYRISLSELGMTPASASKVSAPDADEGKADSVAAI